jgi:hypothetical protein
MQSIRHAEHTAWSGDSPWLTSVKRIVITAAYSAGSQAPRLYQFSTRALKSILQDASDEGVDRDMVINPCHASMNQGYNSLWRDSAAAPR